LVRLSKPRKTLGLALLWSALVLFLCLLYVWLAADEHQGRSVANPTEQSPKWFERLLAPMTAANRNEIDRVKVLSDVSATANTDRRDAEVCHDFMSKNDPQKIAMDTRGVMYAYLRQADSKLKETLMLIAATGDPLQKATALLLSAEIEQGNARESYFQGHPHCEINEACQLELSRLQMAASRATVDAVAKMAVYSKDPSLYATAFHACASLPTKPDGFCTQVNAAQWASRDPENGIPWLHVLQELSQGSEGENQSTIADALYKISKAKRFDAQTNILSQLPNQTLSESDSISHARLQDLAFNITTKIPTPSYRPIINACKGNALNDGNRRAICEDLASQLQRENASMIEVILSGKIGEQLGWDKVRTQSIQDDRDAFRGLMIDKANKALAQKRSQEDVMKLCLDDLGASRKFSQMNVEGEYKQYQEELTSYPVPRTELIRMGKK